MSDVERGPSRVLDLIADDVQVHLLARGSPDAEHHDSGRRVVRAPADRVDVVMGDDEVPGNTFGGSRARRKRYLAAGVDRDALAATGERHQSFDLGVGDLQAARGVHQDGISSWPHKAQAPNRDRLSWRVDVEWQRAGR